MIDENIKKNVLVLMVLVAVCIIIHIAIKDFGKERYINHNEIASASTVTTSVVFVSETGTKYHMSDCRYLKYGSKRVYLDVAIKRGYTACSLCAPYLPKE